MAEIKQVIVMRKDLNMRRGKEIAQGSHAAMAFLSIKAQDVTPLSVVEREWLEGTFTKICVKVNSEAELLQIEAASREAGLQVSVITDSGKTEFAGIPTKTCLAIGPDLSEKIDRITGNLALY
jgi:PTH2 family peptidyl-tRNA hydrolase